jgi:acetolactate synthase-1/2/3 large subunit
MAIHAANCTTTPMIIMSGEAHTYGEDPDFDPGRQWFNSLSIVGGTNRLLEPVVKWANQVTSSETLYETVVHAGELAQRTPAGPTYLNVPIENMMHEWRPPEKVRKSGPPTRPRAPDGDIEEVAKLLVTSDYPVITTEAAGRQPEGFAALVALAELLAIPVVESGVAKFSNFPKDHPLHQGFDFTPHLDAANLVLSIRNRVPWYPPSNSPGNATVVAVEETPFSDTMVYQSQKADRFLEGDAVASMELLAEAVRALGFDAARVEERRARWAAAHDKLHEGYRAAAAVAGAKNTIDPITLCTTLSEVMPDNAVYVDETTTHRMAILKHLRWNGPHDYVKVPTGLGQGLGTAIGVKLACKDRPVVSIIGDGGFLYNPVTQSLGFSMEAELPILIVVFNNQGYLAMKNNQLSYYPDGTGKQNDLFYGHPIAGPDYGELAKPFGGVGWRVDDPTKLKSTLKAGLAAVQDGKTAIINVVLDS